jgi:hypothetical protein
MNAKELAVALEFIRERTFLESSLSIRHFEAVEQVVVAMREAVAHPEDQQVRAKIEAALVAAKSVVEESQLTNPIGFASSVFRTAEELLST